MKVVFRPSLQEHIEFLTDRQKRNQPKVSSTVTWIFFAFNLGFVPAMLISNDHFWAGIVLFVINAVMLIFLLSWQQTNNIRKYYQETWPQLEDHDCEITIDENGVESKHAGNRNFFPWANVRTIGQTERLIFFDVGPTNVLVSKRCFINDDEGKKFIDLAKNHKNTLTTN